ncbi:uncharacterized protein [Drosophila suzukii]|uniref:Uncharacterized protein n=1 Tax=Drosophila suzukii TaxID=28584 RepID=A0ABM4TWU4_DROSZ
MIVKAFNFRASRQNRSFPGFDTTVVRLLHGLLLSSMTPSYNILSISSSTTFCFAGDIGYGRSLKTRAPSISSMECLYVLVTPRPSLSKVRNSSLTLPNASFSSAERLQDSGSSLTSSSSSWSA